MNVYWQDCLKYEQNGCCWIDTRAPDGADNKDPIEANNSHMNQCFRLAKKIIKQLRPNAVDDHLEFPE